MTRILTNSNRNRIKVQRKMKRPYNVNIPRKKTTECYNVQAVSYTHLDVYKRQAFPVQHQNGSASLQKKATLAQILWSLHPCPNCILQSVPLCLWAKDYYY